MKVSNLKTSISIIALSAMLVACGGGGGSSNDSTSSNNQSSTSSTVADTTPSQPDTQPTVQVTQKLIGTLTDSPIANISYRTTSGQTGKTNAKGEFTYVAGDSVTFYIGDLTFPSVPGSKIVTPLELFSTSDLNNPSVINALRFFQSLDDDGIIDQSITLTDAAIRAVEAADLRIEDFGLPTTEFSELPAVTDILANEGVTASALVSETQALKHFEAYVVTASNLDSDNDGLTNDEDSDDDNDGIFDSVDASPLSSTPTENGVDTTVESPTNSLSLGGSPVINTTPDSESVATDETVTEETPVVVDEAVAQQEEVITEQTPVVEEEVVAQQEEVITEQTPVVEESTPDETTPAVAETVNNNTTYSALLSWSSPDARENGAALEIYEIGGFEIKYKSADADTYTSILVNESTANQYLVDNLPAGTYEFMIATIDADGIYSDFSAPLTYSVGV